LEHSKPVINRPGADILFSLLGMSPGVLTETLWALAAENPPVFPDMVVVLTTEEGSKRLTEFLLESGNWDKFVQVLCERYGACEGKLRFGPAQDHIRLFPRPDGGGNLEEITNAVESEAAADYMMRCLREFTEDPGTRVIASIAGGRKTMSALLLSCMSLLGRTQDRLCHVLVSRPYDDPRLTPPFLFPEPAVVHSVPGAETEHPSEQAVIELIEVPFVRVRGWYERDHHSSPPSYMSLVRQVQQSAPPPANYPVVSLGTMTGALKIGSLVINLSATEFAVASALLRRSASGKPMKSWSDLEPDIMELRHRTNVPPKMRWLHDFQESDFDFDEDMRKLGERIRRRIRGAGGDKSLARSVIPHIKGRIELYPGSKIRIEEDS